MCTDPGFDLQKKCSFRDLTQPVSGREPGRLKVGKMQVQIPDRVRVDVTMPADAFDPVSNIRLRLFAAEEQRRPVSTTQPSQSPSPAVTETSSCTAVSVLPAPPLPE